jgi:hypothetical protein
MEINFEASLLKDLRKLAAERGLPLRESILQDLRNSVIGINVTRRSLELLCKHLPTETRFSK